MWCETLAGGLLSFVVRNRVGGRRRLRNGAVAGTQYAGQASFGIGNMVQANTMATPRGVTTGRRGDAHLAGGFPRRGITFSVRA
jgi:hypothetical protein